MGSRRKREDRIAYCQGSLTENLHSFGRRCRVSVSHPVDRLACFNHLVPSLLTFRHGTSDVHGDRIYSRGGYFGDIAGSFVWTKSDVVDAADGRFQGCQCRFLDDFPLLNYFGCRDVACWNAQA